MDPLQAEQQMILTLFDSIWFRISVLNAYAIRQNARSRFNQEQKYQQPVSGDHTSSREEESEQHGKQLHGHRTPPYQQRSQDRKKLNTILSGKEGTEGGDGKKSATGSWKATATAHPERQRRREKKKSKSMSQLEYEELKGFADLGFNFSKAEAADPRLITIVPGLQHLRKGRGTVDDTADAAVFRPYLSEAWDYYRSGMDLEKALRSRRLPTAEKGMDLRDHIRTWAREVASTVA